MFRHVSPQLSHPSPLSLDMAHSFTCSISHTATGRRLRNSWNTGGLHYSFCYPPDDVRQEAAFVDPTNKKWRAPEDVIVSVFH